ncbi:DUF6585 family protein [Streptomyces sp. UNOC14_S4]|uniref:DUF6585 family protein n=1 Tax=Streptomyces sp. UNOC14_S4 TaxID=2872340 RepID=UPI001E5C1F12|nr:DUF6585 family protein [Streptomyces sp. UNOC14_S4]MCC3768738.1 hypothetical protein [Streptomyces sp. UNOC14_S4]
MDEQEFRPDGHAAELAERERLGRWRMTAPNQQGTFRKRWGEARLHLYEHGLVVTDPEGLEQVRRWDATAAVLQNLVKVNGALRHSTYTLIDAHGAALTVGRGSNDLLGRHLDRLGATSHTRGPGVVYERAWGPEVQKGVTSAQLPSAIERLSRGETLTFGHVSLDRDGMSAEKKTASWSRIAEVVLRDGMLKAYDASGKLLMISSGINKIPNLYLLLTLAQQLPR